MKISEKVKCPGRFRSSRRRAAFTMIEIALSLAIIGFALVAIIGVLPAGLNVQRNNREDTIINQDAIVWMNAIRNGAQGYDDLTNYVFAITNYWTIYEFSAGGSNIVINSSGFDGYGPANSYATSSGTTIKDFALTNGFRIIGLLSTPTFDPPIPPVITNKVQIQSNYVIAYVRAFSGLAADKAPQQNETVLGSTFMYKMIVENFPYIPVDARTMDQHLIQTLQMNSHDLRLTFRWPFMFEKGDVPANSDRRQTYRVFNGGNLLLSQDPYEKAQKVYFFQHSTYVQLP